MSEPVDATETVRPPDNKPPRNRRGRAGRGPTAGSWTRGRSGNPAGRPGGFRGVAAEIMAQTADGAELVAWALEVWRDTSRPYNERRDAHAWLSDRGLGRPVTTGEITLHRGDDEASDVDYSRLTVEQLRQLNELHALALTGSQGRDSSADPRLHEPSVSVDTDGTYNRSTTGDEAA